MIQSPPRFQSFTIAKLGNAEHENEDRSFARIAHRVHRGDIACIALSDGATDSAFAREWAETLVGTAWCHTLRPPSKPTFGSALPDEQVRSWLHGAQHELAARTGDLVLPWYGRAKAREGAAASFLGVWVTRAQGKRSWTAVACGDTCLLHLSGESGPSSFPLDTPAAFGNRPMLVSSDPRRQTPLFGIVRGVWKSGDRFILATDALAAWLLDTCTRHERLAALLCCDDEAAFAALVEQERAAGRLKNDDTTALIYCP